VDAPLAAQHEREMLHGVRHVHARGGNAGFVEQRAQQASGGTHERNAFEILVVAGLLADEHQRRARWPLAGHPLRRVLPEVASAAVVEVLLRRRVVGDRVVACLAGASDHRNVDGGGGTPIRRWRSVLRMLASIRARHALVIGGTGPLRARYAAFALGAATPRKTDA